MTGATVATVIFGVPTTSATPAAQDSVSTTTVAVLALNVAGLFTTLVTASVPDFEAKTTAANWTFGQYQSQANGADRSADHLQKTRAFE